jgi:hypothetical protein
MPLLYFAVSLQIFASAAGAAEYIFPQVADGKSSSLAYVTTFLLNNVNDVKNTITLSLYQGGGTPWLLELRSHDRPEISGRNSTFSFTLEARETVNIFTAASDPIAAGWARVQSSSPLNVSEVFSSARPDLNPQRVNWEAGVLSSPVAAKFSFEANYSSDDTLPGTGVNTGYAIVNPNSDPATVLATLYSRTGTQLEQKTIPLPANGQIAEFVNQRFNVSQLPGRFHGLVRLQSDLNIALCALRNALGAGADVYSTVAVNPDFTLGFHPVNEREPSFDRTSALQITLPAEIVGAKNVMEANADGDWFAVSLPANQTLYVVLVADILGSSYDGDVTIRDSAGNQLKRVDNWASGINDAALDYRVTTAGTYYVQVMSRSGPGQAAGASYRMFVMAR